MTTEKKPIVIIIFGPPGSGKGTQGELLADTLGLYYFETSKILERNLRGADEGAVVVVEEVEYFLKEEKIKWQTGKLMSTPLVLFWMAEKVRELGEEGKGVLFAGSPRTVLEAEKLMPALEGFYGRENMRIVHLDLSVEESILRNSHRRICSLLRHPILYSDETKNLTRCPFDGSELIRREMLDDPETIKVRFKEYEERTKPMLEFFVKQGFEVKLINGEQTVEQVFKDILEALGVKK